VLDVLGALVWAVVFALGGWYLGEAMEAFLHDLGRYEVLVLVGIAAVGGTIWLVHLRRSRKARRADGSPVAHDHHSDSGSET